MPGNLEMCPGSSPGAVKRLHRLMLLTLSCLLATPVSPVAASAPLAANVPGVVINHLPTAENSYVGSPSITVLPDGTYVTSHDMFGPGATYDTTLVFRSTDRGLSWTKIATIKGQFWSNLFVHRGALFLLGTSRSMGVVVIRRSDDGGVSWTTPDRENNGLLWAKKTYRTAPTPVVEHGGRLWRAMSENGDGKDRAVRAFIMSAPADADLLLASNWSSSPRLPGRREFLEGRFGRWVEGNAVVSPAGDVLNILRVQFGTARDSGRDTWENYDGWAKAALINHGKDGKVAAFDPANDFVEFPGGLVKFTVRKDPQSEFYWALTTAVPPAHRQARRVTDRIRNTVVLTRSRDLRDWEIRCIVLYSPDLLWVGYQYLDWVFEGADLLAVSRTATPDGTLGPGMKHQGIDPAHDANYLTFHRLRNFRDLTLKDSVVEPRTLGM